MARERLADLDESKEEERERKLKLQEKNRRAQQAFRWRQKVCICNKLGTNFPSDKQGMREALFKACSLTQTYTSRNDLN